MDDRRTELNELRSVLAALGERVSELEAAENELGDTHSGVEDASDDVTLDIVEETRRGNPLAADLDVTADTASTGDVLLRAAALLPSTLGPVRGIPPPPPPPLRPESQDIRNEIPPPVVPPPPPQEATRATPSRGLSPPPPPPWPVIPPPPPS